MIASAADPVQSATSLPSRTSVTTTYSGTGASSSRSNRRFERISACRRPASTRLERFPRKPARPSPSRTGNTSPRRNDSQSSASSPTPSSAVAPASQPALMAPTLAPTSRSGRTPPSPSARSMPTWTAPRLAPPDRTNAVVMPGEPAAAAPTSLAGRHRSVGAGSRRKAHRVPLVQASYTDTTQRGPGPRPTSSIRSEEHHGHSTLER